VYEESRNVLDVSLRIPLFQNVGLRFDAKNLLDAPYRVTQGDVVRERFTLGRVFAFGFTWRN
jgi:outer membrane receptor protein involved in Fe transport